LIASIFDNAFRKSKLLFLKRTGIWNTFLSNIWTWFFWKIKWIKTKLYSCDKSHNSQPLCVQLDAYLVSVSSLGDTYIHTYIQHTHIDTYSFSHSPSSLLSFFLHTFAGVYLKNNGRDKAQLIKFFLSKFNKWLMPLDKDVVQG